MCNNKNDSIMITPVITGAYRDSSDAPLQVSSDFLPIVYFKPSEFNDDSIRDNLIFMEFEKSDSSFSRKKAFVKRLDNSSLTDDDVEYYIPYLRIWPPINEDEERIFKLACMIEATINNCCEQGNIYIEMPEIKGLKIKNIEGNVLKDIRISETFTLELSVNAKIDREKKDIDALPLVFYVMNDDNTTNDVGKIHLSIAPKDTFSKAEIADVETYLQNKPNKTHKIRVNGELVGHDCLTAVRISAEKLLGVSLTGAIKKYKFNIWIFKDYLEKTKRLKQSIEINIGDKNQKIVLPISSEKKVSKHLKETVENNPGYHFIAIGAAEIHTLVLIIDYSNINKPTFSIYDQYGYSGRSKNLKLVKDLEYKFIDGYVWQEIGTWQEFARVTTKKTYPAQAILLKIQHALLIILLLFSMSSCKNLSSKNIIIERDISTTILPIDGKSSQFKNLYELIISKGLIVCKEENIDTTYTYFFESIDSPLKEQFSGGYIIYFDEDMTDKPMFALHKFQFNTKLSARSYIQYMIKHTFQLYNFSEKKHISLLSNDCARLYRKGANLYLINCCWDTRLSEYFNHIAQQSDELDWDENIDISSYFIE